MKNKIRRRTGQGIAALGIVLAISAPALGGAAQEDPSVSVSVAGVSASGPARNPSCSITTNFTNDNDKTVEVTVNQTAMWLTKSAEAAVYGDGVTKFTLAPGASTTMAVEGSDYKPPYTVTVSGQSVVRPVGNGPGARCGGVVTAPTEAPTTTVAPTTTAPAPTTTAPAPTVPVTTVPPTTSTVASPPPVVTSATTPAPTVPEPTTEPPAPQPELPFVVCVAGTYPAVHFYGDLPDSARVLVAGQVLDVVSNIPTWIGLFPLTEDTRIELMNGANAELDCHAAPPVTSTTVVDSSSTAIAVPEGELPYTGSHTVEIICAGLVLVILGSLLAAPESFAKAFSRIG